MPGGKPAKQVRFKNEEAEERRLIEAAKADRARFIELYEKYFDLVYAYVARRTRNRAEAEDLTAETFRKALENLRRFKWTGAPFGAWLLRIASNLIADRAKRRAKESNLSETSEQLPDAPTRAARNQLSDLEAAEREALLFRMVDELSADQRRVIVMRFAEEKSIRKIAGELKRSEGAVKQLQFRALENLRKMIQE
jgi:RNA polymerase sigma-70 factor (ECF subfamily)